MADTEDTTTPQDTPDPVEAPETPDAPADEGKGSKAAVLADLASERDKRQAAERTATETSEKLDRVLAALGMKDDPQQVDPDQVVKDLRARDVELAVLRTAAGIADADALLDSRGFLATLESIDPSDRAAVKAHVTEYVTANPRFAVAPPKTQGARDAAAGPDRQSDNTDWIRAAARR
ncbi:hypothetical protein [Brachybacterium nesterenkovii]|uniref:hypothetical protein n=1 Tax=Brachybacterium nesterenkovii TaxID=47847 RepID=UPI00321B38AB